MYQSIISKMLSTGFKRAALFGLVGAILTTGIVVGYANITATDLGTGNDEVKLAVKTFVDDTEVTLDNTVLGIVSTTGGAVGDTTGGAVETVVATYAAVNNALTADNYFYSFDLHETVANDWLAGEKFKIQVFGYNSSGSTSTLLATLYTKQDTAVDATIEGVRVTVDLGSSTSINDNFDIIVERY